MTCRECQEQLLAETRHPRERSRKVAEQPATHLAACAVCRDFAGALGAVAVELRGWECPVTPDETAAQRAALVARLAAAPRPRLTPLDRPLVPAMLGAIAAALGVGVAPDWLWGVLLGWTLLTGLTALFILIESAGRRAPRGEGDRWTLQATD